MKGEGNMLRMIALCIVGVLIAVDIINMLMEEQSLKRVGSFVGACLRGLVLYYIWIT